MKRKAKKNLVIALQVLLLGGLISWIMSLGWQDRQQLLDRILLPETEASSIRIERGGGQLAFRREGAGWQMTEPQQSAANENRIMPILSLLTLPASHRYNTDDVDEALLGLEPAQATVLINQLSFSFGHADASGQKRYLKTGNSVFLVDDLVYPLINGAADTFIAATVTE